MITFASPWYDALWMILAATAIALLAAALKQWFRLQLPGLLGVAHLAAIVLLPIIGPIIYLAALRTTGVSPLRKQHQ